MNDKAILLILFGMTRHAQITEYNKSGKSLQYLKKEVRDEFDFWASKLSMN